MGDNGDFVDEIIGIEIEKQDGIIKKCYDLLVSWDTPFYYRKKVVRTIKTAIHYKSTMGVLYNEPDTHKDND